MSDATPGPGVPEQRGVRDQARGEVLHRARDGGAGRHLGRTPQSGPDDGVALV